MRNGNVHKKTETDAEVSEGQGRSGLGLNQANFSKVAPSGFGDPLNAYPHSMAWFDGCLYVGTTRANLHLLDVGNKALPGLVGDIVWPVSIPDNIWDMDLRAQIWRYDPRTCEWKKVFVAPMVKGIDGHDVPLCVGFRVMTVFQGKSDSAPALYVNAWASSQRPETTLLRSVDGINFEIVSEPGMGLGEPVPRTLRALTAFKGRIYTAPAMGSERGKPNTAARAVVLTSDDPANGGWLEASEPNFGDPNNTSLLQMEVFDDHLYASTMNVVEGLQVWKTDGEGELPFRWTRVLSHGAYRGRLNQMALSMRAFGDHIYIGSAIQTGGYDRLNNIGPDAPELIRIAADDTWDLLVGEARVTPDGFKVPLSGHGPGFGNAFSGYFWQMCEHDGWLYLSNSVWSTFFMFADQEGRRKNGLDDFDTRQFEEYLREHGGFNLWRTKDGVKWKPVTMNGFGNYFNIGVRNMVSTPYGLFAGVSNSFGPEVAVRRLAGWTYEPNKDCGLEIWLGNREDKDRVDLRQRDADAGAHQTVGIARQLFHRYSSTDMVDDYYGGSGFRCSGLWHKGIDDVKTACENLMDEVLAFIPDKNGTVLDIGCGLGATSKYLLKAFKPADVTGVVDDAEQLKICKRNVPDVNFLRMKLPALTLAKSSFDNVICIEGMGRFKRREALLASIYGVLRKGGNFIFTDMLYAKAEEGGSRGARRGNKQDLVDIADYKVLLEKTGFRDLRIEDVTKECWESFSRDAHMYFLTKSIPRSNYEMQKAYEDAVQKAFESVMNKGAVVNKYLLIYASR